MIYYKKSKGMLLVEIIIAIFIITVALFPMMSVPMITIEVSNERQNYYQATQLAASKFEEIAAYEDIPSKDYASADTVVSRDIGIFVVSWRNTLVPISGTSIKRWTISADWHGMLGDRHVTFIGDTRL